MENKNELTDEEMKEEEKFQKELRITKRETYDEILNRLMESFLNKKE